MLLSFISPLLSRLSLEYLLPIIPELLAINKDLFQIILELLQTIPELFRINKDLFQIILELLQTILTLLEKHKSFTNIKSLIQSKTFTLVSSFLSKHLMVIKVALVF